MLADYFYWQYIWAPRWLLRFLWNLQRAAAQFFSVPLMLRTLIAHWHKDAVPYRGGTLTNYAMTFGWNMVSRGIGFIIRSAVIAIWLAIEAILIPASATVLILFLLWPLLVITGISLGLGLMTL